MPFSNAGFYVIRMESFHHRIAFPLDAAGAGVLGPVISARSRVAFGGVAGLFNPTLPVFKNHGPFDAMRMTVTSMATAHS